MEEKDIGTEQKKNNGAQNLAAKYAGYTMFITLIQASLSVCGVFLNNRAARILCVICASACFIFSLVMVFVNCQSEISHKTELFLNALGLVVTFAFILFALIGIFRPSIFEPKPTQDPAANSTSTNPIEDPAGKIAAGNDFSMLLRSDKTVDTYGETTGIDTSGWKNITQIAAYQDHAIGLREDKTVVVTGARMSEYDVSDWSGIKKVAACQNGVIGLTEDGDVEFEGPCSNCMVDCDNWSSIKEIIGAAEIIVVQKKDNQLIGVDRYSELGNLKIEANRSIVSGTAFNDWILFVLDNGRIDTFGDGGEMEKIVSQWTDMVQVAVGSGFALGLQTDGGVIPVGAPKDNQLDVSGWKNVVAICAGKSHALGLCEDGTVVTEGNIDGEIGNIVNENYWVN